MSTNCPIATAILPDNCETVAGGTPDFLYITNKSQLTSFTATDDAISALTMAQYGSLFKFYGRKNGNTFGEELANDGNGNRVITQTIEIRVQRKDILNRVAIDELIKADDLIAFIPTNEKHIEVFGIFDITDTNLVITKGGEVTGMTRATGQLVSDNAEYTITLTAVVKQASMLFLDTDFADSIDTLDGYL